MNPADPTLHSFWRDIYCAWRRVCLRQVGQLSCSPLAIIGGLAVMVLTIEIGSRSHDVRVWVFLLAGWAAVALVTLAILRLLRPAIVLNWPQFQEQPAVQDDPGVVPQAPPGLPSFQVKMYDLAADVITNVLGTNESDIPVSHPDSVERREELQRIKDPV